MERPKIKPFILEQLKNGAIVSNKDIRNKYASKYYSKWVRWTDSHSVSCKLESISRVLAYLRVAGKIKEVNRDEYKVSEIGSTGAIVYYKKA